MELTINKGDKFLCIKTVVMNTSKKIAYFEGNVYTSDLNKCITDEQGDTEHFWTNPIELLEHFTKITDQSFNIWN